MPRPAAPRRPRPHRTLLRGETPARAARHSPRHQLDEMVVQSDAGTGVEDGGVGVAVEVCGHDLSREKQKPAC